MMEDKQNAVEWLLENNSKFREAIQARLREMIPGNGKNTAFKPEFKEEEEYAARS